MREATVKAMGLVGPKVSLRAGGSLTRSCSANSLRRCGRRQHLSRAPRSAWWARDGGPAAPVCADAAGRGSGHSNQHDHLLGPAGRTSGCRGAARVWARSRPRRSLAVGHASNTCPDTAASVSYGRASRSGQEAGPHRGLYTGTSRPVPAGSDRWSCGTPRCGASCGDAHGTDGWCTKLRAHAKVRRCPSGVCRCQPPRTCTLRMKLRNGSSPQHRWSLSIRTRA